MNTTTMPLAVHEREVEGIVILDLHGRLVLGPEATDLRGRIEALATENRTSTILNLKQLSHIDSTGLGYLVIAHTTLRQAGGALKLLHVSRRSAELLVLTKLSTIFEVFDDEQLAINSFFPDREVRQFDILEFVKSQEGNQEHLGASDDAQNPENA